MNEKLSQSISTLSIFPYIPSPKMQLETYSQSGTIKFCQTLLWVGCAECLRVHQR